MRIIVRGEKAYSLTSIAIPAALKERVQDYDVNMTEVCVNALEREVERLEKVEVPV
jgi:hypothetical protein